jgi:hypothetical protein
MYQSKGQTLRKDRSNNGGLSASLLLMASLTIGAQMDAAQASTKIFALLTQVELDAIGFKTSEKAFVADGPTPLKKGMLPGLNTDLQLYQCTGEFAKNFDAFLVRWDLVQAKDSMDKKAWQKLNESLDNGEKKAAGSSEKATVIAGTECSEFSWGQKKGGHRVYAVNCSDTKGKQMVSLEFAHIDQKKLPSPADVKKLLDKMLARM